MGPPNRNDLPFRTNSRPPLPPGASPNHRGTALSFRNNPVASNWYGSSASSRPTSSQFSRNESASFPRVASPASTARARNTPNHHRQAGAQGLATEQQASINPEDCSSSETDSLGRDAAPDFVVDQANAMREEADVVQEIMEHESAMVELEKKLEKKVESMIETKLRAETKLKKYAAKIVDMRTAEQEDFEEIDSMRMELNKVQSEHKEKVAQFSDLEEEKRKQEDASEAAKQEVIRAIAEKAEEVQRNNAKLEQDRIGNNEELRRMQAELTDFQADAKQNEKKYAEQVQEASEFVQALRGNLRKTKSQHYEELKLRANGIAALRESVSAEISSAASQLSDSFQIEKRATKEFGEFDVKMRDLTDKSVKMLETRWMKVQEVRLELRDILSNAQSSRARFLELQKEHECVTMKVKSAEHDLSKVKHYYGQLKSKYEEQHTFLDAEFERVRNRTSLSVKRGLDCIADVRAKHSERDEEDKQVSVKCRKVSQVLDARIRGLEKYVQRLNGELRALQTEQDAASKVTANAIGKEKTAQTKLLLLQDEKRCSRQNRDDEKAASERAFERQEKLEASISVARKDNDALKKGQGRKTAKGVEDLEEQFRSEHERGKADKRKVHLEEEESRRLEKKIKVIEQLRNKKVKIKPTIEKSRSRVQGRSSKSQNDRLGRSTSPKQSSEKKKTPRVTDEMEDVDLFEEDIWFGPSTSNS